MPNHLLRLAVCLAFICLTAASHPPLRQAPAPAMRPLAKGPAYFVDAQAGDDKNAGDKESPWLTVRHAMTRLRAGDTLYLRGGVYYENVRVALAGREKAPITIRSFPGEQAIVDGGLREFFDSPATAWAPYAKGGKGEFRSARAYPNLRNVVGSFGDSMIGLQTYYHAQDLRSESEIIDWADWKRRDVTDMKPLYCGPGMWYDRQTGYLHARLAATNLPDPVPNYRGPSDPRKLPLVVAPFRSVPLHVDRGEHLRFQDLVLRGGGYATVRLDHAMHVEFDNVTIWCGTYGMRASATGPLRLTRCGLYGNVAPWTFRGDGSKRDYPGRPHRNISRLNTHAVLDIDSGRESSVYATPQNDRWELAHCEFTDAHDAVYLGAINVRFHHNLVENMQDDGVYLSPMYHRHRLDKKDPEIHIYQNVFRGMLTALAFGGSETTTRDRVFIYRNLFDLRAPVQTGRPSTQRAEPGFHRGQLIGDHGSPPWSAMNIYHNTFVAASPSRYAGMGALSHTRDGNERRVFNNIFYHFARLPGFSPPNPQQNAASDANLYWSPSATHKQAAGLFTRFRSSVEFLASKKLYPPGSTTNSIVADPKFLRATPDAAANDYRLGPGSPAKDAGVKLPDSWPDPSRDDDDGKPDLGAIPSGSELFPFGRSKS